VIANHPASCVSSKVPLLPYLTQTCGFSPDSFSTLPLGVVGRSRYVVREFGNTSRLKVSYLPLFLFLSQSGSINRFVSSHWGSLNLREDDAKSYIEIV
jgi:hypothetical protein